MEIWRLIKMENPVKAILIKSGIMSAALALLIVPAAQATSLANQSTVDNGVAYLKAQQNVDGHIGAYSSDTGWSAVALASAGNDLDAVKTTGGISLLAYLKAHAPSAPDNKATDWERSIIAITAAGQNPYDFGGINYIAQLKNFVNGGQIGLTTALNDDFFGLMALLAGRVSSSDSSVTNELAYVLASQHADGGFSYSTDSTIGSDTNDTAAAVMALKAAQNAGLGSALVSAAVTSARAYLLGTQNVDGGFPYDPLTPIAWGGPVSDGSSTSWVLMSLTSLGEGNSTAGANAQAYLRSLPLVDGSFPSWQPTVGDVFDTAPAVTALAGGQYPLYVYDGAVPEVVQDETPTPTPTNEVIPTPTATPVISAAATPTPTPTPAVLGASTAKTGTGSVLGSSTLPVVGTVHNSSIVFVALLIALATGIAIRVRQLRLRKN
jgi:prenyltransferase beta subunit